MLDKLLLLSPRDFEHLAYDLLTLCGVKNLVWRTPGADGGRDLEGVYAMSDLSGDLVSQRWYFECKRYASSISWPVVYEKVSYAANQGADFLLFISTSSLSTQCLDEVSVWNGRGAKPIIRHWPGYKLSALVAEQNKLVTKYALAAKRAEMQGAVLKLSGELAKAAQSAYSAQAFGGGLSPTIELAAALAELLNALVDSINAGEPRPVASTVPNIDLYQWCKFTGDPALIDRMTLRALLSTIRLGTRLPELRVHFDQGAFRVDLPPDAQCAVSSASDLITEIAFWGDLEVSNCVTGILFTSRRSG